MHGIARIKLLLLTIVLLLAGARRGAAQPVNDEADFTIRSDEVRLEGTIKTLDRITGQFVLNVDITVSRGDETGEIAMPGPHRVQVKYDTSIVDRSTGVQGLQFDNIGAGVEAIVIGHSKGNGQFIEARVVAVARSVPLQNAPLALPSRRQRLMGSQGATPWTLPPVAAARARPARRSAGRTLRSRPRSAHSAVTRRSTPRPSPRAVGRARAGVNHPAPAPVAAAVPVPALAVASPRKTTNAARAPAHVTPAPPAAPMLSSRPPGQTSSAAPTGIPSRVASGLQPHAVSATPTAPRAIAGHVPALLTAAPRLNRRGVSPRPTPAFDRATAMPDPRPARLAMALGPLVDDQASGAVGDRSTNPLGTSTAANAVLNAVARTHFHALKMAQDDVHYAYFSNGSSQEKLVALTFDDGPNPDATPRVLDILKREGVPATFFVIGRNAARYPQLVLRALAEGHSIGNHTFHHRQGVELTLEQWRSEIELTNDVIMRLVGAPTRWFRAPGCHYTPEALQAIHEMSMVRVDTTNNSSDWDKRSADSICEHILSGLAPGNVILMHDPMPQTAVALPTIIHQIKALGYRFVSLEELAQRAQATPGFFPQFRPEGQGIVITAKE